MWTGLWTLWFHGVVNKLAILKDSWNKLSERRLGTLEESSWFSSVSWTNVNFNPASTAFFHIILHSISISYPLIRDSQDRTANIFEVCRLNTKFSRNKLKQALSRKGLIVYNGGCYFYCLFQYFEDFVTQRIYLYALHDSQNIGRLLTEKKH